MITALLILYGLVGLITTFYVGNRILNQYPDEQPSALAAFTLVIGVFVVAAVAGAGWPVTLVLLELERVEKQKNR